MELKMNLYEFIKFNKIKVRHFRHGYIATDYNNEDYFEIIDKKMTFKEFAGYLLSFFIVIGIPLLIISIILSVLFSNVLIFLYILIALLISFISIILILYIISLLLELFLCALLDLFVCYEKFLKK